MAICSVEVYRALTGDLESYDGDVADMLVRVQGVVEGRTRRHFDSGTYTETLPVLADGKVYPSAVPLVSATGYSATQVGPTWIQVGISDSWRGDEVTVTYIGGYDEDAMPPELQLLVAQIARRLLPASVPAAAVPAGATSVKVGDVSYSGPLLGRVPVALVATEYNALQAWARSVQPPARPGYTTPAVRWWS